MEEKRVNDDRRIEVLEVMQDVKNLIKENRTHFSNLYTVSSIVQNLVLNVKNLNTDVKENFKQINKQITNLDEKNEKFNKILTKVESEFGCQLKGCDEFKERILKRSDHSFKEGQSLRAMVVEYYEKCESKMEEQRKERKKTTLTFIAIIVTGVVGFVFTNFQKFVKLFTG